MVQIEDTHESDEGSRTYVLIATGVALVCLLAHIFNLLVMKAKKRRGETSWNPRAYTFLVTALYILLGCNFVPSFLRDVFATLDAFDIHKFPDSFDKEHVHGVITTIANTFIPMSTVCVYQLLPLLYIQIWRGLIGQRVFDRLARHATISSAVVIGLGVTALLVGGILALTAIMTDVEEGWLFELSQHYWTVGIWLGAVAVTVLMAVFVSARVQVNAELAKRHYAGNETLYKTRRRVENVIFLSFPLFVSLSVSAVLEDNGKMSQNTLYLILSLANVVETSLWVVLSHTFSPPSSQSKARHLEGPRFVGVDGTESPALASGMLDPFDMGISL
ncbi:hypothetical protein KIPB_003233 [Kipferlia bialata]|uniref:Uncharacterized protein n=1 Tax=Kipferlia bialata TaxID=797122 RepID=A0A9K3GFE1_9EUKA|nr:hypothetical protein KIPB_002415 [Kipferlia bialata]GIQ81899.1 hypothetical protein KIPB_002941 [Kipferlia bialata]GIQ82147.1 hypothetical protein KIPB_003233 [Kipferlia bialata]|eukprot:g2415.t1